MIPILALLLSSTLAAAPINLGQEMPVGDAAFGNAALSQTVASVASNGSDYLVLWNDARGINPTTPFPALWVGRVDASGHPVEATGHKLVDGALGQLVWTGTAYALVYSVGGISFEQLLDDNGNPISPPIHLSLGGPSLAVGTNGSNILTTDISGEIFLVDFDGGVFRQHIGHQLGGISQIAAAPGGNYFFATTSESQIELDSVDNVTAVVTHHPLTGVNVGTQMNGVASDDGRMLIAWNDRVADAFSLRYEIVDSTGHVLGGPALLFNSTPFYGISVGWDGHDFLVAVAGKGWRIASNGPVLDQGSADTGPLLFAHSAAGVLEARNFSTTADVDAYVRAAPSFAQLAAAEQRSVAMSSRSQQRPGLAASEVSFTAWFEAPASLMVQPAGGPITHIADVSPWDSYQPPALGVARGGSGYLIAWEAPVGDKLGFLAKRLALDGTPIDANPIPFAFNDNFQLDVSRTISIAFDGTNFLAVWAGELGAIHGVRISLSGKVLDGTPLVLAQPNNHDSSAPRVVWNGKNFVIAWLDELSCHCLISPPPPPIGRVYAIRAGSDGQPLDSTPIELFEKQDVVSTLALATNGDDAALVWTGANCVFASTLRADGTPAGEPRALTCQPQPVAFPQSFDNAGLAWSGSEYVAIWRDIKKDVIRAERLDEGLAPIDDFDVSPDRFGASQPDIASTASGVAIAYVRYAPEARFGGAPRIFVRSLARLGPSQRRRAFR